MSKGLKKVLVTGAALLMFASISAGANNVNVNARHVRTNRVAKLNHKNNRKFFKKHNKNNKRRSRRGRRANRLSRRRSHRRSNKKNRFTRRRGRFNRKQAERLANKARRKARHNKKAKKNNRILKPRYRRSNNKRVLKASGFVNLNSVLPDTPGVQSKYAPNDHRAVIPKKLNVNGDLWLQAKVPQLHPILYQYVSARHGWVKLGNL